jgi:hypothetical protein
VVIVHRFARPRTGRTAAGPHGRRIDSADAAGTPDRMRLKGMLFLSMRNVHRGIPEKRFHFS